MGPAVREPRTYTMGKKCEPSGLAEWLVSVAARLLLDPKAVGRVVGQEHRRVRDWELGTD